MVALLGLSASVCAAQTSGKVALETSETLFTVLSAMNACGYNAELNVSDPLRAQIRAEVATATQAFDQAKKKLEFCASSTTSTSRRIAPATWPSMFRWPFASMLRPGWL